MGDRFYRQQLEALGDCPGNKNPTKRTKKVAWDDDKKAQAVSMYEDASPTPETSMEIVKDIAEELDESPNGVRMILTKAGVYVKKTPAFDQTLTFLDGSRILRVSFLIFLESHLSFLFIF